jgi:uncharacterized protein (TIGR00290 family)
MRNLPKAVFFWSGGKDSALCLYKVLQQKQYDVVALLTTLNETFRRISMHGVREELLEKQAEVIGIPLVKMYVREGTNSEYEQRMNEVLQSFKEKGVTHVIYGDIFLEDLRKYRDDQLEKIGMKGVYPLWKNDTKELIHEFLSLGFKTITCCTNDAYLNEDRVGEIIDEDFIRSLPPDVDPCGENGEFHTFCFDGPLFRHPVHFTRGEKIYKPLEIKTSDDKCSTKVQTRGFWFCELL